MRATIECVLAEDAIEKLGLISFRLNAGALEAVFLSALSLKCHHGRLGGEKDEEKV